MKEINFLFKKENLFIIFLFITYIITAFNSVGFYKDDEHFQILEPIAYLLGINNVLINDPNGYYWEWYTQYRIRPWFQPHLYFQFISILKFFNINDPFSWALSIRLINGLLGFLSIVLLFFSIKKYFVRDNNLKYYFIYFTFWFFPFLHTRTSSESLSITLFILSFPFLLHFFLSKQNKINFFKVLFFSFIMGLSIVVRPQIIFTIFPIFLWLIFFNLNIYKIFLISIGCFFAILVGFYIDYLHWGFFTNTYIQIYKIQILAGRMISFGEHPFWFYFVTIIKDMSPIFGFFYLVSIFLFGFKNYKNIFTWLTFGTLIILLFFGHKATRFIFQIYIFAPFFFFYLMSLNFSAKIKNIIFYSSLLSNLVFLIIISTFPANSKVDLYKHIYSENIIHEKIYYLDEDPYQINQMKPYFYTTFLPEIKKLDKHNTNEKVYLVTNNYNEHKKISINKNCMLNYTTYPLILINLVDNLKNRKMNWYLYKCNAK